MIDFRARRATAAPPYLNEIAAASQVVKPSYVNGLAGHYSLEARSEELASRL